MGRLFLKTHFYKNEKYQFLRCVSSEADAVGR